MHFNLLTIIISVMEKYSIMAQSKLERNSN